MQTQETPVGATSDNEVPSNEKVEVPSQAEQMAELNKVAKMQAKVLSGLVRAHFGSFLNQLAFAPKVKGNEKAAMIIGFLDGLEGVLDLGVDVTGVRVPEKGAIGKNVATMMGIFAQAQDNRMLLLAHNMDAAEKANEVVDLPVGSNVEANKAAEAAGV